MKKLIYFNLILLIVYSLISYMYSSWKNIYILENYTGEFQNFEFSEPIDVVNTGTSHGSVAFDWKITEEVRGVNLARSGQPFASDRFLLNFYSGKIKGATVIVPISFHSFCLIDDTYTPLEVIYGDSIPFFGMVQTAASIDLYFDSFADKPLPNGIYDYIVTTEKFNYSLNCEKEVIDYNTQVLIDIVSNNNVVLITTPYYSPILGEISNFKYFYSIVDYITSNHNVEYFDFSRDNRFNSREYFYSANHLNEKGRTLFTEIVIKEVLNK